MRGSGGVRKSSASLGGCLRMTVGRVGVNYRGTENTEDTEPSPANPLKKVVGISARTIGK